MSDTLNSFPLSVNTGLRKHGTRPFSTPSGSAPGGVLESGSFQESMDPCLRKGVFRGGGNIVDPNELRGGFTRPELVRMVQALGVHGFRAWM